MFKKKIIKIVGSTNNRWGQLYSQNGLFLVLELEMFEDAGRLGRQIIEKAARLYQTIEEKTLSSTEQLFSSLELEDNISLIIGVVKKNILYLVGQGKGEVRIKRGKTLGKVFSGEGRASGILQEGDVVIFSSPAFAELVSAEKIEKLLKLYPWEEAGEHLASLVQGVKKNEGAAGLLVKFFKKEEESLRKKFVKKTRQCLRIIRSFRRLEIKKRTRFKKRRRLTASVGLLLAFLLIGSLIFGNFQKEKIRESKELARIKEEVLPKIKEGEALVDLNVFQARKILSQAKSSLEGSIGRLREESKERKEAEKLLEQVNKALSAASRVFKFSQVPLFFNLAWIKEGAYGFSLALYKDNLAVLDKKNRTVYKLNLSSKKSQIAAGGEALKSASKLAVYDDKIFILLAGEKQSIVNAQLAIVVENNKNWGEIADLTAYAGNLYLLDKKGVIWKYPRLEEGFGSGRNYLASGLKPDFSRASSMSIDGAVWVLNRGVLTKFVQGTGQNFSLQALAEGIQQPVDLFTDEQSENIYLLDKKGQKIVVFDKKGRYQSQYFWEKLSQADDFVVSEKLKKIFVLLGGKIYTLEIKQ